MNAKHCLGNVTVRLATEGNRYLLDDGEVGVVAIVLMTNDPAIAKARAELFTAAPELLASLKEMLDAETEIAENSFKRGEVLTIDDWQEEDPEGYARCQRTHDAIQKAEGVE